MALKQKRPELSIAILEKEHSELFKQAVDIYFSKGRAAFGRFLRREFGRDYKIRVQDLSQEIALRGAVPSLVTRGESGKEEVLRSAVTPWKMNEDFLQKKVLESVYDDRRNFRFGSPLFGFPQEGMVYISNANVLSSEEQEPEEKIDFFIRDGDKLTRISMGYPNVDLLMKVYSEARDSAKAARTVSKMLEETGLTKQEIEKISLALGHLYSELKRMPKAPMIIKIREFVSMRVKLPISKIVPKQLGELVKEPEKIAEPKFKGFFRVDPFLDNFPNPLECKEVFGDTYEPGKIYLSGGLAKKRNGLHVIIGTGAFFFSFEGITELFNTKTEEEFNKKFIRITGAPLVKVREALKAVQDEIDGKGKDLAYIQDHLEGYVQYFSTETKMASKKPIPKLDPSFEDIPW